ncbi:MAG: hypothetical protein SV775_12095 [Thermodesulfobacteriota bacterium]|nr:hypothetical protein [Thermodesulfobacteriota bacterium]
MTEKVIWAVPNTGRHNACHMNSCHMVLHFHGVNIPLPRFIPLSGFGFGFMYLNDGGRILPSASGCPCRDSMSFITEQLGYEYETLAAKDIDSLWLVIKEYIDNGLPLVAGPLPLDLYRQHNPQAPATGFDSFCVISGYDEDRSTVYLSDTFGLCYMQVSRDSLEQGWEVGKRLCPVEIIPSVPFLFVVKGRKKSGYDELEVSRNVLKRACEQVEGKALSDRVSTGLVGQKRFLRDLGNRFNLEERKLPVVASVIRDFVCLIGAQSKFDIAYFLRDYASRIVEAKGRISDLAVLFEREGALFLEALGHFTLTSNIIQAGLESDCYFSRLHEIFSQVVSLEENELRILKEITK